MAGKSTGWKEEHPLLHILVQSIHCHRSVLRIITIRVFNNYGECLNPPAKDINIIRCSAVRRCIRLAIGAQAKHIQDLQYQTIFSVIALWAGLVYGLGK